MVTRCLILLCTVLGCGASIADSAIGHDIDWAPIQTIVLQPGQQSIVLVAQHGEDFAIRVNGDIQDSPDQDIGVEIVAVENTNNSAQPFVIEAGTRFLASASAHTTTRQLTGITEAEFNDARFLMQASRTHFNGTPLLEILPTLDPAAISERIRPYAHLWVLQALDHGDYYNRLLEYMSQHDPTDRLSSAWLPDVSAETYHRWLLAVAYQQTDQIDLALQTYQQLEAFLAKSNPGTTKQLFRDRVRAHYGLTVVISGMRTSNQTRMNEGAELIRTSLANISSDSAHRQIAHTMNYLAAYQSMSHQPDIAIRTLKEAERHVRQAGDEFMLPLIKNNLAFSYMRLGLLADAQNEYQDGIRILEKTPFESGYTWMLRKLAESYVTTGDLLRAKFYAEKNRTESKRLELNREVLKAEILLAEIERTELNHTAAISRLNAAAAEYATLLDKWLDDRVKLNVELAQSHLANGDIESARRHADQAWVERDQPINVAYNLDIYAAKGSVLRALGDQRAAVEIYEEIITRMISERQESLRQLGLIEALVETNLELGNPSAARTHAERGERLISTIRQQLLGLASAATWDDATHQFTNLHAGLLLSTGDPNDLSEAFNVLQNNRATNFRARRAMTQFNQQLVDATSEQNRLRDQLLAANKALLTASSQDEALEQATADVFASEVRYRALAEKKIEPAVTEFATLPLHLIQAQIDRATTVVSYVPGKHTSYFIEINADSVQVHHLPGEAIIDQLADSALSEITSARRSQYAATKTLSDTLLGQIDLSNTKTLILELQGVLNKIPFAALYPSAEDNEPIANTRTVTNTLSLAHYFDVSRDSPVNNSARNAVIIADPAFAKDLLQQTLPSQTLRSGLAPLRHTKREAMQIQALFPSGRSQLYLGKTATVSSVLAPASRSAQILHLASHGLSDDNNENLVGFLLATDAGEPDFLTIEDINRHHFTSDLVVINGCSTTRGRNTGSEGMMGLSTAFLQSGAKATIGTLWPVTDQSSAKFMTLFYQSLTDGLSTTQALQQAQLQLKAQPRYRSPYYWAPYVLHQAQHSESYEELPAQLRAW